MNSACPAIAESPVHYRLAGRHWISQWPIRYLQAFATDAIAANAASSNTSFIHYAESFVPQQELTPVAAPRYSALTRLALRDYHLQVWWPEPSHCCLEAQYPGPKSGGSILPFVQKFDITPTHITCHGSESLLQVPDKPERWVDEAGLLLGPVMAVHLAMNGVFLLHASAMVMDDTLCVFLAESGSGKSTLVAQWHELTGARIADDILPVRINSGNMEFLPDFPQLKLKDGEQVTQQRPRWQQVHWFFLKPLPATHRPASYIQSLDRQQTLLQLGRHSVATRLLPAALLGQHLQLCQQASALPAAMVHYPHSPDQIDAVFGALDDYLQDRFR
jgi:hypothetical protein